MITNRLRWSNVAVMSTVRALVAALLLPLLVAACGSSSDGGDSGSSSASTTTTCPFSGSMASSTNAGTPGVSSPSLTGVEPQSTGCIDQVTLTFSGGVAPWSVGYEAGSDNPALTIQLGGTALQPPTPVSYSGAEDVRANGLTHVDSITVTGGGSGGVAVVLALDAQRPYATSMSNVPPTLIVTIG